MSIFFFFNDTATTEIYTLSLHDALPICQADALLRILVVHAGAAGLHEVQIAVQRTDRKSTRLNSSHLVISYAVFCLKKKKKRHCRVRKALFTQWRREKRSCQTARDHANL